MARIHQAILIGATILGSWLGMQAVHESGHILGAWISGGRVAKVVLNPLTISRTDIAYNPNPLFVVWAGPIGGVLIPLLLWGLAAGMRFPGAFVLRFFAGFCLIANGLYIGVGSFDSIGDCGEMLRHGSSMWQLWLFGLVTVPTGFLLLHRLGSHFGLGPTKKHVRPMEAYLAFLASVLLAIAGLAIDGW